ncbi:MAG: S1 family peptidase [Labrys sp. (in: a-proteobacteria)]
MPSFIRLCLSIVLILAAAVPARAITGGSPAEPDIARHLVMLTSRKSFCTAIVIAPRLLLTVAHCVDGADEIRRLRFAEDGSAVLDLIERISIHPRYNAAAYRKRQFTIDVALVSLPEPIDGGFVPLPLPSEGEDGILGARYRIAGFGLSIEGDGRSGGVLREALLRGIGPVSDVQLRLESAAGAMVGACQGDSGGPVLRVSDAEGNRVPPVLVGLLASAKAADGGRGCGGRTGTALLKPALEWIRAEARRLGVTLSP